MGSDPEVLHAPCPSSSSRPPRDLARRGRRRHVGDRWQRESAEGAHAEQGSRRSSSTGSPGRSSRSTTMRNVQALMRDGADAPNAYLGHLGAVTVVTHNVITTGALPKNMGWTDEGYRDVDGVLKARRPDHRRGNDVADQQLAAEEQMFPLQEHAGLPEAGRLPAREAAGLQGRRDQPEDVRRLGARRCARGPDHHLLRAATSTATATRRPTTPGVAPTASRSRRTSRRPSAAASTWTPTRRRSTTPGSRPPGSTRWTRTATRSASTRSTRAATSGRPTRRSRP